MDVVVALARIQTKRRDFGHTTNKRKCQVNIKMARTTLNGKSIPQLISTMNASIYNGVQFFSPHRRYCGQSGLIHSTSHTTAEAPSAEHPISQKDVNTF